MVRSQSSFGLNLKVTAFADLSVERNHIAIYECVGANQAEDTENGGALVRYWYLSPNTF